MAEKKLQRADQITFEEVTEVALSGVLRALEVHRKDLADDGLVFKKPPIIWGIWIMPDELGFDQIQNIPRQAGKG
jgi:hypothetical protein